MGKSTISTGPFSIAMLVYQRVHQKIYPGSVGNFLCLFASDKLPGFDTFDKPIGLSMWLQQAQKNWWKRQQED